MQTKGNIILISLAALLILSITGRADDERVKSRSVYLEKADALLWIDGLDPQVTQLIEGFQSEGFEVKSDGDPRKVLCIIDTFVVLAPGRERGTAIKCGETYGEILNNNPLYAAKIVEYVESATSPFQNNAESIELMLYDAKERVCFYLQRKNFTSPLAAVHNSRSIDRLTYLAHALVETLGYKEGVNYMLCNSVLATRTCTVNLDYMKSDHGGEPKASFVSCQNLGVYSDVNTKKIFVDSEVSDDTYASAMIEAIREGAAK